MGDYEESFESRIVWCCTNWHIIHPSNFFILHASPDHQVERNWSCFAWEENGRRNFQDPHTRPHALQLQHVSHSHNNEQLVACSHTAAQIIDHSGMKKKKRRGKKMTPIFKPGSRESSLMFRCPFLLIPGIVQQHFWVHEIPFPKPFLWGSFFPSKSKEALLIVILAHDWHFEWIKWQPCHENGFQTFVDIILYIKNGYSFHPSLGIKYFSGLVPPPPSSVCMCGTQQKGLIQLSKRKRLACIWCSLKMLMVWVCEMKRKNSLMSRR